MLNRQTLARSLAAAALAFAGLVQPALAQLAIGTVGPLSGSGTQWGLAMQRAVQIAAEEVNAAGGIPIGGKPQQIKLISYDDQYTGQGGTTAGTRLVNLDGVKFILGPLGSPPALGLLQVTTPAKVLVLSNGFSPKVLTPKSEWNFRVVMSAQEFGPGVVQWVRTNHPNARRMALITTNDATGQAATEVLKAAYSARGFENVAIELYERGVEDFTPLLTRMIAKGMDVLELGSNAPNDAGLIVRQARQLGYKGLIVQTGGPGMDEVIKIAGKDAEGFVSYDSFDPNAPGMQQFLAKYRARHGQFVDPIAPLFYNAAVILFEGIRRAGVAEPEKVRDAIRKMTGFKSPLGDVRWSGMQQYGINHQLMLNVMITQVRGGKIAYVGEVTPAQ